MKIGAIELIVIFVVALLVIGPDKLPYYMKQFGKGLASFRKATDEATSEIRKNVVEPLEEAQKPLKEALEPVEELHQAVTGDMKNLTDSINNIGKPKKNTVKKTEAAAKAEESGNAAETAAKADVSEGAADPSAESTAASGSDTAKAEAVPEDCAAPDSGDAQNQEAQPDTEAIRRELAETAETLRRLQAQLEAAEGKNA